MAMTARLAMTAFALALLGSVAAVAHDTYIVPDAFAPASLDLKLSLTSAEDFPKLDYGPDAARVSALVVHGPDHAASLKIAGHTDKALQLGLSARVPGTYLALVVLAPRDIELTPPKVDEYLTEIGASDAIRTLYAAQPQPRRWLETYTKYAKTIVCLQTCAGHSVARQPLGAVLEFVEAPQGAHTFRLLYKGEPLAGQPVAVTDGHGSHLARTDAGGDLSIEAARGPVLLSTVRLMPRPGGKADFTSDFATLTFDPG